MSRKILKIWETYLQKESRSTDSTLQKTSVDMHQFMFSVVNPTQVVVHHQFGYKGHRLFKLDNWLL